MDVARRRNRRDRRASRSMPGICASRPTARASSITEIDRQLRTLDVFIRNGSQPAPTRLSLSTDVDESGVWSPDGLRIAWAGQRRKVMLRGAGAVLPEQTIATFDTPVQVWDWSRDARVAADRPQEQRHRRRSVDPAAGRRRSGAAVRDGAVRSDRTACSRPTADRSPTRRTSPDSSISTSIRIRSPARASASTTAGGTEPRWSADGRELFFRRGSEIHAVAISTASKSDR